jgi:hypothetical protein
MSQPSCTIRCQKCNAKFGYVPGCPQFVYRTASGEAVPAEVGHGWCDGCNKPVPMQLALSPAQISAHLAVARTTLDRFPKPGIFGSLFQKRLTEDEYWEKDYAETKVARLLTLQSLLQDRTILPRCLECECDAVESFGSTDPLFHHACGGSLIFTEGPWVSLVPSDPIELALR